MKNMRLVVAVALLSVAPATVSAHGYRTDCEWVQGLYHAGGGIKVYAQNRSKGRHAACGAAWGQRSLRAAKRNALQVCSQFGPGCRIVRVMR